MKRGLKCNTLSNANANRLHLPDSANTESVAFDKLRKLRNFPPRARARPTGRALLIDILFGCI